LIICALERRRRIWRGTMEPPRWKTGISGSGAETALLSPPQWREPSRTLNHEVGGASPTFGPGK
jgi:hypothetical protein